MAGTAMNIQNKIEPDREEMYSIIKTCIPWLQKTERVQVWEADGRTVARDIAAVYPLPGRPVSAYDGIGVRFSDFAEGIPETSHWKLGRDYVFANTGVAIQEGFDTVIAIEDVDTEADSAIRLRAYPDHCGEYVVPAGSQIRPGETLACKGEKLFPALLGVLAAAGHTSVPVYVRPRVLFLPTGDELVPFGGKIPAGSNAESNSVMLAAMIRRFGGLPAVSRILADDPETIRKAILEGIGQADIVIIGAGSSKGSKDFTMKVLESIGTVKAHELAVAPGKHCSLTMVEGVPVMGIPGPPGGAQLIGEYYVRAAIERLTKGEISPVPYVGAVLEKEIAAKHIDFMHGIRLSMREGTFYAMPCAAAGRTRGESRQDLNCICYCPRGRNFEKGEQIKAELPFADIPAGWR